MCREKQGEIVELVSWRLGTARSSLERGRTSEWRQQLKQRPANIICYMLKRLAQLVLVVGGNGYLN